MRSSLRGHHGWLILAVVIAVIDLTAADGETLSHAAHRAVDKYPLLTIGFITITATHLIAGSNDRYAYVDPYRLVGFARRWTL